jgi:hypothetical protein
MKAVAIIKINITTPENHTGMRESEYDRKYNPRPT